RFALHDGPPRPADQDRGGERGAEAVHPAGRPGRPGPPPGRRGRDAQPLPDFHPGVQQVAREGPPGRGRPARAPVAAERRRRRALREDLFGNLLEAAAAGPSFRGVGGPDRVLLYTLAANTGFRASELASLTPRSFDLAADPPTVTVEASYSKHRRQDVQPLRA